MDDTNPTRAVGLSILDKANESQDTYITNPNMKKRMHTYKPYKTPR